MDTVNREKSFNWLVWLVSVVMEEDMVLDVAVSMSNLSLTMLIA